MKKTDSASFASILAELGEVYGEQVSPVRARLYFEALRDLTLAEVRAAAAGLVKASHFFPKPADLLELAATLHEDGHLGPEEAWALVAGLREEDSVVWTDEIAQAFGVARRLLQIGDPVGGRKAFLEVYPKKLAAARQANRAPVWWASLGYDNAGRVSTLRAAVEKNQLPAGAARAMLGPHEWPDAPAPPALPAGPLSGGQG